MCVCLLIGVRVCIGTALKSSCSVSYDRPSVCRCSGRSAGVPGEASKSSQGSGGGEPRLSESFSMFIHPAPLLLLLQRRLRQPHSASKCGRQLANPYPLTTHPFPCVSHSVRCICQFFQTSLYLPFHFTSSHLSLVVTSLPSPSLNFASVTLPLHLHLLRLFSPNHCSQLASSFPSTLPPVEQHIQQYINLHTSL